MESKITIGVLALQGDFAENIQRLESFGPYISTVEVRYANQLSSIDGLIIPGGESTTNGILMERYNLLEPLKQFVAQKPVWGICAGAIMLSNKVKNIQELGLKESTFYQPIIGGLNATIIRNFYGPQINSSVKQIDLHNSAKANNLATVSHFIRAPLITDVAKNVEVLATVDNQSQQIAAVKQGNILATVFHPEVTQGDYTWHAYFINMIKNNAVQIPKFVNSFPELPLAHNYNVKNAFPRFLQGGVIMDVVNVEQAKIAESAGACCVMALERIPADIKADGGVSRMSDPRMIKEIQQAISIPVMAKSRIGHFGESRILEAINVDCIDESEVLTPADITNHTFKEPFKIPFVCGCKSLGEALRRISEGAQMIRIKGDAGTGNVVNAVEHCRTLFGEITELKNMRHDEVFVFAKKHQVSIELCQIVKKLGRLPVITFAAGGIATPADVMLVMNLGCDGCFVGSGIFKSENALVRAKAIVDACTYYQDAHIVGKVSENLGKAMVGLLKKGEEYVFVNNAAKL